MRPPRRAPAPRLLPDSNPTLNVGLMNHLTRSEFLWRAFCVFLIAAAFFVGWKLATILLLVFGGLVFALVIRIGADALARVFPLAERWAAVVVILTVIMLIGTGAYFFGAEVAGQLQELRERLPRALEQATAWFNGTGVGRLFGGAETGGLSASGMVNAATATAGIVGYLLVVVFVAIYVSFNPSVYRRGLVQLFPSAKRPVAEAALDAAGDALRGWLVGQLVAMVTVGALTWLGLWLVGVPLAVALGLVAGVLEFVPILGPFAAAVPGILLGFTVGPDVALYAAAVYLVVQQLEGNLITPLAQRWAVHLPPAVGVVTVIAFGVLFGIPGILFATPLTVVILALVRRLYLHKVGFTRGSAPPTAGKRPAG